MLSSTSNNNARCIFIILIYLTLSLSLSLSLSLAAHTRSLSPVPGLTVVAYRSGPPYPSTVNSCWFEMKRKSNFFSISLPSYFHYIIYASGFVHASSDVYSVILDGCHVPIHSSTKRSTSSSS